MVWTLSSLSDGGDGAEEDVHGPPCLGHPTQHVETLPNGHRVNRCCICGKVLAYVVPGVNSPVNLAEVLSQDDQNRMFKYMVVVGPDGSPTTVKQMMHGLISSEGLEEILQDALAYRKLIKILTSPDLYDWCERQSSVPADFLLRIFPGLTKTEPEYDAAPAESSPSKKRRLDNDSGHV